MTHSYQKPVKASKAQCRPKHNVASNQANRIFHQNRIKASNRPDTPKMTNGLVQHITVEEFTSIQWVKTISRNKLIQILKTVLEGKEMGYSEKFRRLI